MPYIVPCQYIGAIQCRWKSFQTPSIEKWGNLCSKNKKYIKRRSKGAHMRVLCRGSAKTPYPHRGLYSNRHLASCNHLTILKLKIIVFSHEPSTWWEDILDQFCHQFENSLMLSPIQFVPVPFKKLFSILYTLEPRTFINSFKAVSFSGRVSNSIGCIQNPSCPLTLLNALKIDLCLMLQ